MKHTLVILTFLGLFGGLVALRMNAPESATAEPFRSPPTPPIMPVMQCFEKAACITYKTDPTDYWQSPSETRQIGSGDCEDKALYLQHLLQDEGIDSQVAFGVEHMDTSAKMHAWVECYINDELYVLDPTNGFIARRKHLQPGRHLPVLGMPAIVRKLRNYCQRTGGRGINHYYEYVIGKQEQAAISQLSAR